MAAYIHRGRTSTSSNIRGCDVTQHSPVLGVTFPKLRRALKLTMTDDDDDKLQRGPVQPLRPKLSRNGFRSSGVGCFCCLITSASCVPIIFLLPHGGDSFGHLNESSYNSAGATHAHTTAAGTVCNGCPGPSWCRRH